MNNRILVRIFSIMKSALALLVAAGLLGVVGTRSAASQDFFVGQFDDWSLTVHVNDVGPFLGTTDLEVRHPFWVSNRPRSGEVGDPTDPADIMDAWTTDTFTNMRTLDGELVVGATLHQEWIAVSLDEAVRLQSDGFATIGSSGGFLFGLIRQTASPEATAAFGLQTIDNGEFIRIDDTVQGICG